MVTQYENEKLRSQFQMLKTKVKLLTKAGKYSDVKTRIKAQQKEIERLNKFLKDEKERINEHKTYLVLNFLKDKGLIKDRELKQIIWRYNNKQMGKKRMWKADKKLDKFLSGTDKINNKYKDEIKLI